MKQIRFTDKVRALNYDLLGFDFKEWLSDNNIDCEHLADHLGVQPDTIKAWGYSKTIIGRYTAILIKEYRANLNTQNSQRDGQIEHVTQPVSELTNGAHVVIAGNAFGGSKQINLSGKIIDSDVLDSNNVIVQLDQSGKLTSINRSYLKHHRA